MIAENYKKICHQSAKTLPHDQKVYQSKFKKNTRLPSSQLQNVYATKKPTPRIITERHTVGEITAARLAC